MFSARKMLNTEIRQKQQAEWSKMYTLNQSQFKQLFENKLRRATEMHFAMKKREALCGGR